MWCRCQSVNRNREQQQLKPEESTPYNNKKHPDCGVHRRQMWHHSDLEKDTARSNNNQPEGGRHIYMISIGTAQMFTQTLKNHHGIISHLPFHKFLLGSVDLTQSF